MARYSDIDPSDIDPDTGAPYAGYSSPALDTSFHDHEMDVDDKCSHGRLVTEECRECESDAMLRPPRQFVDGRGLTGDDECPNGRNGEHRWVCRDDNEEISYCENCGADGNG